jgi:hypothetical protein
MNVEICEAPVRFDVLCGKISQKRRLAAAGSPKHGDVRCASHIAQAQMPSRYLFVGHLISEIQRSTLVLPCSATPPTQAVPDCRKDVLEERNHRGVIVQCSTG